MGHLASALPDAYLTSSAGSHSHVIVDPLCHSAMSEVETPRYEIAGVSRVVPTGTAARSWLWIVHPDIFSKCTYKEESG